MTNYTETVHNNKARRKQLREDNHYIHIMKYMDPKQSLYLELKVTNKLKEQELKEYGKLYNDCIENFEKMLQNLNIKLQWELNSGPTASEYEEACMLVDKYQDNIFNSCGIQLDPFNKPQDTSFQNFKEKLMIKLGLDHFLLRTYDQINKT